MGRNSKFNAAMLATVRNLYALGKTDQQVANIIGVSVRTIYYWKGDRPDFLQALKEGTEVADDLVEASLFHRATGYRHAEEKIFCFEGHIVRAKTVKQYPPDTTAAIFWLKNRRPDFWRESSQAPPPADRNIFGPSFEDFCVTASYPKPYPKQIEMKSFGMDGKDARLLLGARGYGKTDYVVIAGIAEKLKLDPGFRVLLITKSKERNAAMLKEIAGAATSNGVVFEKENSHCLRVAGLHGKDHSVSAVTIKTVTLRGRHPDLVIMDDPVTEDDISEATRKHVERVYNEVNKLVGNILIIGQPAHQYDLYAKLRPLLRKMEVPHGTIPELDHDLEAQRLAGVDENSIQASYFLKVITDGASPFSNIKYCDKMPAGDTVAFIDPSDGGDYTAVTIMKAYLDGVAVYGKQWKKAWYHCLDDMIPVFQARGVRKLCFETNSTGTQPIEQLQSALKPLGIGVVGKHSDTNKHAVIMAAGAYAHLIHLSKESDRLYTDHVVKYEYKSEYDDAPDSLARCLEWLGLIRGKS